MLHMSVSFSVTSTIYRLYHPLKEHILFKSLIYCIKYQYLSYNTTVPFEEAYLESLSCSVHISSSCLLLSTKFADDRWMVQQGFLDTEIPSDAEWWWNQPVTNLPLHTPITVHFKVSCDEATETFHREQIDQMPIVNDDGYVGGLVSRIQTSVYVTLKRQQCIREGKKKVISHLVVV